MRRLSPFLILAGAVATSALVGCFVAPGGEGDDPDGAADPSSDPTSNDPTPVLDDAGQPIATGIPCDIEKILAAHCSSCHGAKPSAPSRLVTFADLTATSVSDKTKTEAEEALARMESTTSPMPPSGTKPTAQEIATFKAWVAASTPMGVECGATDAGAHVSDAGTKDAAPAPNPYNTPLVCTSKKTWSGGYSSTMHPGVACIGCHSFNIAGTVYPTAHEPDNCDGVAGGMNVVVTDAHNKTATIAVNSAGNFLYAPSTKLVPPFTVKVVSSKGTRVMAGKAPNGNCNSCHTVKGASSAPGRIMAP